MTKMTGYTSEEFQIARRLAFAVIVSIALGFCTGMPSSAQTQAPSLPGVSLTISPSSTSISNGQNLNVTVTLTNSSGRSLFIYLCDKSFLGLVRVQDAAGKGPPGKGRAPEVCGENRYIDLIEIPTGSSITARGSVTSRYDLSQAGAYTLMKGIELYDQSRQNYDYWAVPVHVTVVAP
jgi:hypothetical protein